jgi:hypothetical protein
MVNSWSILINNPPAVYSQLRAVVPEAEPRSDLIPVPPDVARLMDKMSFSSDDVLNMDRSDMTKICDLFEQDPTSSLISY